MIEAKIVSMQDELLGTIQWEQETGKWDFTVADPDIGKALRHLQFRGTVPLRTGDERDGVFVSFITSIEPTSEEFIISVRDYLAEHVPTVFDVVVEESEDLTKAKQAIALTRDMMTDGR